MEKTKQLHTVGRMGTLWGPADLSDFISSLEKAAVRSKSFSPNDLYASKMRSLFFVEAMSAGLRVP